MAETWVVEGRISDMPHAHPIKPQPGKAILYLDTVAEGQLVVYAEEPKPESGAWVRLSGKAIEFETTSPRPGSTKKFKVRQLDVEKVEPMPASDAVQAALQAGGAELEAAALRAGKDAVPVLTASLEDPRVSEEKRAACRALLQRLKAQPVD